MEETMYEMNRLCEKSREQLRYSIDALFKSKRSTLIGKTHEVVANHVSIIRESQIENYVFDNYIRPLQNQFEKINEQLFDRIRQVNMSIARISENSSLERLSSIMYLQTNELTRRVNSSVFDYINHEFSINIANKICRILDNNRLVSQRQLDEVKYGIKTELVSSLKRETSKIFDVYISDLNNRIKDYQSTFEAYIDRMKEQEEVNGRRPIYINTLKDYLDTLGLLNIIIKETFDGLTIVNPINGKSENLYQKSDGTIVNEDETIKIVATPNELYVECGISAIKIDSYGFRFGPKASPDAYQIRQDFTGEYHFTYYGIEQLKPIKQNMIIDSFKNWFPRLYESVKNTPSFARYEEKAKKASVSAESVFLDGHGNIRLNPEMRESTLEMFKSSGFEPLEKEDGLYFIVGGKERKVKPAIIGNKPYTQYLTIDGLKGFSIVPDMYIGNNGTVTGPYFKIDFEGTTVIVPRDFSAINLFIDKIHYGSRVDELGNINYFSRRNKVMINTPEEAEEFIKRTLPGIYSKNREYQEKLRHSLAEPEFSSKSTLDLLQELDEEPNKEVEEVNNERENIDIDKEIESLLEEPNVKRYLELIAMKQKREQAEVPVGPKM